MLHSEIFIVVSDRIIPNELGLIFNLFLKLEKKPIVFLMIQVSNKIGIH